MEIQEKRYLLFDLDGTLTASGPGIMNGVRYALQKSGVTEIQEETLSAFIGPPLWDTFMRLYNMSEEEAQHAVDLYRDYYNVTGVYENEPYDGVRDMLEALKQAGFRLAIATSKPSNMVEIVLSHFSLKSCFELVVCGTDSGPLYTKAGVIAEVLKQFAAKDGVTEPEVVQRAVMIGDRKHDIEGGKKNSMDTIGVAWGYAPEGELSAAGADRIVEMPAELSAMLLKA